MKFEKCIINTEGGEIIVIITPETRQLTDRFFRRSAGQVEADLQGMLIQVAGTRNLVGVEQTRPWDQVGPNYIKENKPVNMKTLNPGEAWAFHIPFRKMSQFLIKVQGESDQDSCVQVLRGSRLDLASKTLQPMKNEGDVAKALQLEPGSVSQLWLPDTTKRILYIVQGQGLLEETASPEPSPSEADAYLQRITGE